MGKIHKKILVVVLLFLLYSCPGLPPAEAASGSTRADYIEMQFRTQTSAIEGKILTYAAWLFWSLFTVSFAWNVIQLALTDHLTLMGVLATLTKHIFYSVFFLLFIRNPDWIHNIYEGFATIGAEVTGSAVSATGIINQGIRIFSALDDAVNQLGVLTAFYTCLLLVVPEFIITLCFFIAAGTVLMMKIEAFIIISVGVIMLGFGGALATRDMSTSYLKYAINYGIKLLVLSIIVFIMTNLITDWLADIEAITGSVAIEIAMVALQVTGASIIFLMLILKLPNIVSGIISGVALGQIGDLRAATGTIGNTAGMLMNSPRNIGGGKMGRAIAEGAATVGIGGIVGGARILAHTLGYDSQRNGIRPGNPMDMASGETGTGHPNHVPPPGDFRA
jgi:type IV secretion system protein TrbL